VKECKAVGLDIGNIEIIKRIAQEPEWFTILLTYSELGLLPKLGKAVTTLKQNQRTKHGN